ncbi:MAG: hypothetical protein H7123_01210 [Thermoleophilia bacterium]|nr:hypothetical protein [Thermoleophilia bacterium]
MNPATSTPTAPECVNLDIESFTPTTGSDLATRFVKIGAALQGETPGRIVASRKTTAHRISPDFAFYSYGTARHFVASQYGVDVARCSAIINSHAVEDGKQVGYIGLWECIDDEQVAHRLIDAATAELVGKGCTRIVGPMDFSTWYGYRFCTGPYDGKPIMLEPYTPEHYDVHWRSYGFKIQLTYLTTKLDNIADGLGETSDRRFAMALADGYTFVHLRMNMFERVLKTMYKESTKAFTNAPNYTPIDRAEFMALYADAPRMMDPRLVWFALAPDGSVAGFAFGVPDHARAATALAGRSTLRARIAALLQLRKADGVLFKTLMVNPAHRGHGLSPALTERVWRTAMDLGYKRVHHVLMHENNDSLTYSERGGTTFARRYAVYELPMKARSCDPLDTLGNRVTDGAATKDA